MNGSLAAFLWCPVRGVMVSMIWPSVKASPCQRKWDSRSLGALVARDPSTLARHLFSDHATLRGVSTHDRAVTGNEGCRPRCTVVDDLDGAQRASWDGVELDD